MDRPNKYILVDKVPVATEDLLAWAKWVEDVVKRRVALDVIAGFEISTVFLGLDYAYTGPPMLFETMVFEQLEKPKTQVIDIDGKIYTFGPCERESLDNIDGYMTRYSTWDEAERGHAATVALVRRSLLKVVNGGIE
jgi:hypothetical protein